MTRSSGGWRNIRVKNIAYNERIGGVYKPGEASQVMLDVLALSNSSMVERRLGLIRLNGDACSKRADPFISFLSDVSWAS